MTTPLSKPILAAVLLSSIPLAAAAADCDHDQDGARGGAWSDPTPYEAYPAPPQSPAAYPGSPVPPPPAPRQWREHRWRERELAEVSAQLRALDADRARFHAENRWNRWRLRRYERWYAARRAELEQRYYDLQTFAWR